MQERLSGISETPGRSKRMLVRRAEGRVKRATGGESLTPCDQPHCTTPTIDNSLNGIGWRVTPQGPRPRCMLQCTLQQAEASHLAQSDQRLRGTLSACASRLGPAPMHAPYLLLLHFFFLLFPPATNRTSPSAALA